jgi:hypothetical protein
MFTASVTVRVVDPVDVPEDALIIEVPAPRLVVKPFAAIVATVGVSDIQNAVSVMSRVVPSEYRPVAVNCCVEPFEIDGLDGVTITALRLAVVGVDPGESP